MPAVPQTKATWTNDVDAMSTTNLHAYLRDPLTFLMDKPVAMLRQTVAQSLTSGVVTAITFGAEDIDDDPDGVGGHSTVTNTSRYTARYPGWYRLGGVVSFASNGTGYRFARWRVNGADVDGGTARLAPVTGTITQVPAPAIVVFLAEGDFVELCGFQTSGAALNTAVGAPDASSMSVAWDRLA